jgi:hypothetical protein
VFGRSKSFVGPFELAAVLAASGAMPAAGENVLVEPPLATSSNVHLLAHIPGRLPG